MVKQIAAASFKKLTFMDITDWIASRMLDKQIELLTILFRSPSKRNFNCWDSTLWTIIAKCVDYMPTFLQRREETLQFYQLKTMWYYDQVSCQPQPQAIADIKMVSLVNSKWTWTSATSRNKEKIENPGLVQQEQIKNQKHTDCYAPICVALFTFVLSCFCSFGPTAVWCLFSLADLEFSQHESSLSLSLSRNSHLWIPLLVPSFTPYAIGRSQLALAMLLPRPLLCSY